MKKRKVKNLLAVMLTMSMMAGMLAGCGNSSETAGETKEESASTKVEETAQTEETAKTEEAADSEEPTVITALTSKESFCGDWNNHRWVKLMEEDLNIDLQIEMIPEDVWSEKSGLYFASDNLPDIIWGNIDAALYGNQGYLLDMTEYITEEATPSIWNAFEAVPDLRRSCVELDGKIYRIYGYDAHPTEWGRQRLYIQKDWCQEILGKDRPDTLEEFTTFIKEVKARDMDGDGDPNNEIPLEGDYTPYWQLNIKTIILGAMGHVTSGNLMEMEGDTAVFVPTTDEYKEMLKYMNMCWEEELLDHEYFTQDSDMENSKVATGTCAVFGDWGYGMAPDAGANYTILKPLTSEYNDTPVAATANVKTVGCVSISADTEHVEKCMQIVDWMMNEDNYLALKGIMEYDTDDEWPGYGHKWEYDEVNGYERWVWYGPEGKNDYPDEYEGEGAPSFSQYELTPSYEQIPLFTTETVEYWPVDGKGDPRFWIPTYITPYYKSIFPNVKFTAEEEAERALIFADIDAYFKEMETRMITGDLDVEESWDEYIQGLKDRGLDRYVEIYQNGLDAWLSN